MPKVVTFEINRHRQYNMIRKNLCANLIKHEYIQTTASKARKAKPYIEKFLNQVIKETKQINSDPTLSQLPINQKLHKLGALSFLQPLDRSEIGTKILSQFGSRYINRSNGFIRVLRLEPRLSEDKSPMSVIELVDSEYEFKLWYTGKIVARLELQGLPLDDLTKLNVDKLVELRPNGEEKFREVVEKCKSEFYKVNENGEVENVDLKDKLENLPDLEAHGGKLQGKLLISKKFNTKPRTNNQSASIPKSPFLK
ncbi:unnamed protein product [Candida verbasci]|uniref:54S ribosomal protein L8, mitochondrial n=1 Tax=Candida verbasci TaxID=1227364 RepID=A0A9W4XEQ8_9ASCO|nr:unnamed protein product [Candida verbasci]